MSTALYEIGGDYGNWGAKVVREGRPPVVIRNVAIPFTGDDEDFRKAVRVSNHAANDKDGGIQTESVKLTFGSRQWLVGQAAYDYQLGAQSETSYSRYGTDEWYALIAASFVKLYGSRSGSVALTFSMPVSQFRAKVDDGSGNQIKRRDQIAEMLAGTWEVESEGKRLTYEVMPEYLDIIPEGAGSLAYLCIHPSGQRWVNRDLADSRVVLFDFGGYTLDVLTFNKMKPSDYNQSIASGILHVRRRVSDDLCNKFSLGSVPAPILDDVIQTGLFKFKGGSPIDVSEIVNASLLRLMKDAKSIWDEQLDGGAFFDAVVITGGGGPVIGPLLEAQLGHRNVITIPAGEAHLANATGALYRRKLARHMQSIQTAAG